MTMVDVGSQKEGQYSRNNRYRKSIISMSQLIWSYQGFAGLGNPWHDSPDPMWKYSAKTISTFLDYLDEENITLESYAIFVFPLIPYSKYDKVSNIIANKGHRSWMKKLRKYAASADVFDEAADLLLQFFQYQIEHDGRMMISAVSIVKKDLEITNSGKYCEIYHRIVDRVKQLRTAGIDPEVWLREKVRIILTAFPESKLQLRTVFNMNALEPTLADLKNYTEDTWREIRTFLGLSQDCMFVNGSIPKGWGASGDDREKLKNVAKIDKDGYYCYHDGTQRRGKRHYSANQYYAISCTPENFQEFKDSWNDSRLLNARPTWEEYEKWGAYPDVWDITGKPLIGRGKSIKWRSLGRNKK